MDGSEHPLPLVTVYHKLQPVQPFPCTFLQAVSGQVYPVGLLNEEKVLSIGTQISAVGVCRFIDGIPQMKSSQALPYFLTEMTKDQLVEDMAFKTTCLFWGGLLLGSLSVLSYATMRNWRRWKVERSSEADSAAAATEFQADEVAGDIPDKELCVICLSRRRGTLFGSCGHIVCCHICASFVKQQSSPREVMSLFGCVWGMQGARDVNSTPNYPTCMYLPEPDCIRKSPTDRYGQPGLAIPIAFQNDYLVDREDSEGVATLKSPLKTWKVKLNDFMFTDGWPEFYKAHELSI
ncbi:E3 ubiquitin-protein ligase SPL2-like [Papaver somniferum]|uniref:E3 ubiquitin-protein ligase SPL2-like n=1 Tax=Papaver somniferum TaxID=3469 RepID=UPI000E6FA68C|nr:E3 ubiquitin-protein ligase SPL2-like [Papaver somniferum]